MPITGYTGGDENGEGVLGRSHSLHEGTEARVFRKVQSEEKVEEERSIALKCVVERPSVYAQFKGQGGARKHPHYHHIWQVQYIINCN